MRLRVGLAALLVASALPASTFTVTNTTDSGPGSLRQAITDANGNAGLDTIAFNVSGAGCDGGGVCTVTPASQLPTISSPVLIDGYTQPGSSPNTNAQGALNTVLRVVLSGATIQSTGLSFTTGADGSTVRGLVVNGGWSYGIAFAFAGTGESVRGCFIGTDAAGTVVSSPHNIRGIDVQYVGNFTAGGPAPADRNLISGNAQSGVTIYHGANALVQGNLVGTDKSGTSVFGGTALLGIGVQSETPGAVIRDNVIGGVGNGIQAGDSNDTMPGMTILHNWVGTDVSGTMNLGTTQIGIFLLGRDIQVGGIGAGEGNVVAFNAGAGVLVSYSTINVFSNPIRGNSIYGNGTANGANFLSTLGLDLGNLGGFGQGGFTPNDLGDGDNGPNLNQNFPLIKSVDIGASTTTVHGFLNSTASTPFTIDYYSNDGCLGHPQDFLQGRTYLGSDTATTDASGNVNFDTVLPVAIGATDKITATATDPDGNTSEFSQRFVLTSSPSSGNPAGVASVALTGFDFLAGATVKVGGVAATNVNVADYNNITLTTPSLPPGSLNEIVVTNTDGSSGTLPNGWIADFVDVPTGAQFYSFVTTLVRNKITVGVGSGSYGVTQGTKRQQMAVFLMKAKHGLCYVPPACIGVFPDVPCSSTFAPWIEALAAEGVTSGCGGGLFCPDNLVTRRQMAVFLLKSEHGSGYVPTPCTGVFEDVTCPGAPAVDFIEQLSIEQITGGCSVSPPLYCPDGTSTRGQMAVFITKTFHLQ